MKKKSKKLLLMGFITIATILLSVIGTKNVSASVNIIDNDNSGTPGWNSSTGTWYYNSASYCYMGDFRIAYTGGNQYVWNLNSSYANFHVESLQAYLNHAAFKDPSAVYYVGSYTLGYINQNLAPGGWNTVSQTT